MNGGKEESRKSHRDICSEEGSVKNKRGAREGPQNVNLSKTKKEGRGRKTGEKGGKKKVLRLESTAG